MINARKKARKDTGGISMPVAELTVEILKQIRDEIRGLRTEMAEGLGQVGKRVDNLRDLAGARLREHKRRISKTREGRLNSDIPFVRIVVGRERWCECALVVSCVGLLSPCVAPENRRSAAKHAEPLRTAIQRS